MSIQKNLLVIEERIQKARKKSPRPDEPVTLLAVSKYHTLEEIQEAIQAGHHLFGENRVQELLPKREAFNCEEATFHLIGPLQTNKVRQVIDKVAMIESLDRVKVAEEIEKRAAQHNLHIPCLLQVNMAGEEQKSGMAPEDVLPFLETIRSYPHIDLQGLMFIAPNTVNKEEVRPYFKKMYQLYQTIAAQDLPGVTMRWLSMGMSGDYEIAIEEGANMVRIGSGIFAKEMEE